MDSCNRIFPFVLWAGARRQALGCPRRFGSIRSQFPDGIERLGAGSRRGDDNQVRAKGACSEKFVNEDVDCPEADSTANKSVSFVVLRMNSGVAYLFAPVMRTNSCSWAGTESQGAGLADATFLAPIVCVMLFVGQFWCLVFADQVANSKTEVNREVAKAMTSGRLPQITATDCEVYIKRRQKTVLATQRGGRMNRHKSPACAIKSNVTPTRSDNKKKPGHMKPVNGGGGPCLFPVSAWPLHQWIQGSSAVQAS